MTPVLILAFARFEKLEALIKFCLKANRDIFVFIDGPNLQFKFAQSESVRIAKKYESSGQLRLKISPFNLGVGKAIPTGIDWAFESTCNLIILEDDCTLNEFAFSYFDWAIEKIDDGIVMASGTSPSAFVDHPKNSNICTTSIYPLIWGWATNRANWLEISSVHRYGLSATKFLFSLLIYPNRILPLFFFLAAHIRIKKGSLKAWDSQIALAMLIQNRRCLIPNRSVVANTGDDEYASHEMILNHSDPGFVSNYSNIPPTKALDSSTSSEKESNKLIEKFVYKLKIRHLLSPFKAILQVS